MVYNGGVSYEWALQQPIYNLTLLKQDARKINAEIKANQGN